MKYRPEFPQRFGCIEHARSHCQAFFAWYNAQHCHSAIGYMTPHSVHYGLAADMRAVRQASLADFSKMVEVFERQGVSFVSVTGGCILSRAARSPTSRRLPNWKTSTEATSVGWST